MLIGELAKKAAVTTRTIRYYEEMDLLGPREKKEGKCAYDYTEADLTRLDKIIRLKKIGFSLEEIREVIHLYFDTPTGMEGLLSYQRILAEHLKETDQKIESLQQFRSELADRLSRVHESIERAQKAQS
jgi:Predicted transcriptional regulators